MAYRNVSFVPGEYYHVYNRGNHKQRIYVDHHDYIRFQELLYLANDVSAVSIRDARRSGVYEKKKTESLVAIGAYCLMPNHFHILLTPRKEEGVSVFMRKLATGYAMYFNKIHEQTGGLFEGKFKAKHVTDDRYLKYMFAYIHLNPLVLKKLDPYSRADQLKSSELVAKACAYPYSSCVDYTDHIRNESMILEKGVFPEYFATEHEWKKEMLEWVHFPDEKSI